MANSYYYIDSYAEYCYPYENARRVQNWGCLQGYVGRRFTREAIDRLIDEMLKRYPYIQGSMYLKISIMECDVAAGKKISYYRSFDFRNNEYHREQRRSQAIQFAR